MSEQLSNLGYLALKKESTAGTAVIPNDFIPLYSESLNTNLNMVDQTPIFGEKFENFNVIPGMRSHRGEVVVLAEPNTSARLFDMLLTKVSTSGSDPYTHTFELSKTTNPNSYTIDVSTGDTVVRYIGAQASQISPDVQNNEIRWKVSISALKSFGSRQLASTPTGASSPYTVVFDTTYDSAPTDGLVADDVVRVRLADGSTIDTTVLSVADGTTITVDDDVTSAAAGDTLTLRPQDVSLNLLGTLLWARTQFRFGATATAALSATQTRVEAGSTYDIMHGFEDEDGSMRSGSFDPAALPRTTGKANVNIKKFFDGDGDLDDAQNLTKSALTVRHYTGATNQYEVRPVFNHMKSDGTIIPDLEPGQIEYSEINYHTIHDTSDGKGMQVVVVNALSTI